jgi:predicted enzyme involved in methoxymalonyl-ACP biosynthesis
VRAKRVEHAVLTYLLRRYRRAGSDCHADYRRTAKNAKTGKVFEEVGFEVVKVNDGVTELVFPTNQEIPDDRIAQVFDLTEQELGEMDGKSVKAH